MLLSEQDIIRRLQTSALQQASKSIQPEKKSAAVLVPLTRIEDDWHLLFIRRAEQFGDIHSGQVAFPGGIVEFTDANAGMTALREAEEEIGLLPTQVTLVGELPDYYSASHYRVTPVVGLVAWPHEFILQATEVSHIFTIPLQWLALPENLEMCAYSAPASAQASLIPYYKPYNGELLWGLTAKITLGLLDKLRGDDI